MNIEKLKRALKRHYPNFCVDKIDNALIDSYYLWMRYYKNRMVEDSDEFDRLIFKISCYHLELENIRMRKLHKFDNFIGNGHECLLRDLYNVDNISKSLTIEEIFKNLNESERELLYLHYAEGIELNAFDIIKKIIIKSLNTALVADIEKPKTNFNQYVLA